MTRPLSFLAGFGFFLFTILGIWNITLNPDRAMADSTAAILCAVAWAALVIRNDRA